MAPFFIAHPIEFVLIIMKYEDIEKNIEEWRSYSCNYVTSSITRVGSIARSATEALVAAAAAP